MESKIETQVILITPSIAKEMMEKNTHNRPLKKRTVSWYARQMKEGNWTLSGQTMSIAEDGTIIDGQHRLAAIIQSDTSLYFNVARNVPKESFINYDKLSARSLSDVLSIEHIPNSTRIAAMLSKYESLQTGNLSAIGFGSSLTAASSGLKIEKGRRLDKEVIELYNKNAQLWQDIHTHSTSCYNKLRLFNISQAGAIMAYLILDKNHPYETVFSFFHQLFFNENVENSSIFILREKLIYGSIGSSLMLPKLKYIYLVKCWNAFVKGKEIKAYSYNQSEVIPAFL